VKVVPFKSGSPRNIERILGDGWDVIVDGATTSPLAIS
jgi:hypothetical protein